jgi:hypothetical protein
MLSSSLNKFDSSAYEENKHKYQGHMKLNVTSNIITGIVRFSAPKLSNSLTFTSASEV